MIPLIKKLLISEQKTKWLLQYRRSWSVISPSPRTQFSKSIQQFFKKMFTALNITTDLSSGNGNDIQRDTLIGTWNKPCNFAGRPSLEPRSSRSRRSRSIYHQPTSASSRSLGFLTMTLHRQPNRLIETW